MANVSMGGQISRAAWMIRTAISPLLFTVNLGSNERANEILHTYWRPTVAVSVAMSSSDIGMLRPGRPVFYIVYRIILAWGSCASNTVGPLSDLGSSFLPHTGFIPPSNQDHPTRYDNIQLRYT